MIILVENYIFLGYDLEIKPKIGDFICFPANSFYLHGVKPILDGKRITISNSWYGKKISLVNTLEPNIRVKEIVKNLSW